MSGSSIILWSCLLIIGAGIPVAMTQTGQRETDRFHRFVESVHADQVDQAIELADGFSRQSFYYDTVYVEVQKLLFRHKRWANFFGRALYYRRTRAAEHYSVNLLTLEALALAKHCQIDPLLELIGRVDQQYRWLLNEVEANRLEHPAIRDGLIKMGWTGATETRDTYRDQLITSIEVFLGKLEAHVPYSELQRRNRTSTSGQGFNPDLWKIDRAMIARLRTPRSLKVMVKNQCPSAK